MEFLTNTVVEGRLNEQVEELSRCNLLLLLLMLLLPQEAHCWLLQEKRRQPPQALCKTPAPLPPGPPSFRRRPKLYPCYPYPCSSSTRPRIGLRSRGASVLAPSAWKPARALLSARFACPQRPPRTLAVPRRLACTLSRALPAAGWLTGRATRGAPAPPPGWQRPCVWTDSTSLDRRAGWTTWSPGTGSAQPAAAGGTRSGS
jgi:hypothetical protein